MAFRRSSLTIRRSPARQRRPLRPVREAMGDGAATDDGLAELLLAARGALDVPAGRSVHGAAPAAEPSPFPSADTDKVRQAPAPELDRDAHRHTSLGCGPTMGRVGYKLVRRIGYCRVRAARSGRWSAARSRFRGPCAFAGGTGTSRADRCCAPPARQASQQGPGALQQADRVHAILQGCVSQGRDRRRLAGVGYGIPAPLVVVVEAVCVPSDIGTNPSSTASEHHSPIRAAPRLPAVGYPPRSPVSPRICGVGPAVGDGPSTVTLRRRTRLTASHLNAKLPP
jgi:hypothetical protein